MSFPVKRPQKFPRNLPIRINIVFRNFDMKIDEKIAPMSTSETKEGWESFWSKLPHSAPLHNSLQPVESRILYIPRS